MFRPMSEFMKCVAEGIAAKGVSGLMLENVPYANYILGVGAYAIKRWREKHAQHKLEEAVKESIGKKADEAIAEARKAVEEAAPQLTGSDKERAVQFVAGVPDAVRQATNATREEDLPFGFTIYEAAASEEEQVKKVVEQMLPANPPRFLAGDPVPGRANEGEKRWVLVRKLGGGGFGEVWLVRSELHDDDTGAIKFCTNPEARAKFLRHEMDVLLRVTRHAANSPNIVKLKDFYLKGDTPWLMYEYVEGGTLADTIRAWHDLPAAERVANAVATLYPIACALGSGHALTPAVVHRDIKPANVLMAGTTPRITDYGIGGVAVEVLVATSKSRPYESMRGRVLSELRGAWSFYYSSPEQQAGKAPDPRDDVHAIGVLAYQMLIGRVDKAVTGNWHARLKKDRVPDALIDLIGRSASDEAADRPKDAREWEAVLAELLPLAELADAPPAPATKVQVQSAPVPPRPAPAPPATPKPVAREGGEEVTFRLRDGVDMIFCWVPKGECQLGSLLAEQNAVAKQLGKREDWLALESAAKRGVHTTKGFWMGKYPVTQEQWYAVTGDMPSHFLAGKGGADKVKGLDTTQFPVESVSWDMIRGKGGFLDQMNALGGAEKIFGTGAGKFALPHEDQWEYACRGGRGNRQPFYFGTELSGTQANMDGRYPFGTTTTGPYLERPTPVGTYEKKYPHPWGLCDMHGNVFEWCENKYDNTNEWRVLRGGSWFYFAHDCRAANRGRSSPGIVYYYFGFRVFLPGL